MRFDKLTIKSQEALSEAQSLATSRGYDQAISSSLADRLRSDPAIVRECEQSGRVDRRHNYPSGRLAEQ